MNIKIVASPWLKVRKGHPCHNLVWRGLSSKGTTIDFNDSKSSFKDKSLFELIRGKLVFTCCQVQPLVTNAERLVKLSYKTLGLPITNTIFKATFFGHFCAGEDEDSIRPTVERLQRSGVGSILDYAAEADIEESQNDQAAVTINIPASTTVGKVQGRVYDYKSEKLCDQHLETFEKAIDAVHNVSPTGFAAIKCTALGNPELLKRASTTLVEIRNLFHRLDENRTGYVTREDFVKTFNARRDGKDAVSFFDELDVDHDGKIDYIEWTNGLQLDELHLLTEHCTVKGPLFASTLDEQERILYRRMRERIDSLVVRAQKLGVRLMIDAEHTYFQPAIDNITIDLAKRFNKTGTFPVVFSTYQMYLKDSKERLLTDMARARKGNYKFAAKLVRGAYMVLERQYAIENGLPDPINDNIEATHYNYNSGLSEAITAIARGDDVEIMIASHNQKSVELALEKMNEHKLSPSSGIYFGQLLGMADHLTFSLGNSGYRAYKYVPYGKVNEVMPYLIRRAQENADALSGAKLALEMTNKELWRRVFGK